MYVICDSQIADKGMANCAHQILGQDLTDVLRKLDDFELGRQVHTVERIQESSHPREGVNRSLSFHPPSVVQLQGSPSTPQVESPLVAYTNRRYEYRNFEKTVRG